MVVELITEPSEFFEDETDQQRLLIPVAIVLVAGIAHNLNTILTLPLMSRVLSGHARAIAQSITVIGVVGGTVGTFVLWFIYAGSFYTLSIIFDGKGRFRKVIFYTGWGFLPLAVHGLISGIAFQYTLSIAGSVPQNPQEFEMFIQSLGRRSPMIAAASSRFLFLGWQTVLWTYALRNSRRLTPRQALLTVSGPVIVTALVNGVRLLRTVGAI